MMASLKLNTQDFSSKLASASSSMSKFANGMSGKYTAATTALTSHNLGLKDTARIVQGIIVSQAFYRVAGEISEATNSLLQFNEQLDYAQVTYSALFGSNEIATDFLGYLKELSVSSIFDYDTLTQASKKLLAYGMEYKNLGYIMEGLTNLGAMSGDTASLDRIAYALGQIYAKGKLSAEEMRQLANAYVPIQKILQDKLGLSDEDLGKVGDLNIPAEQAINAIVDYANEQFGSVGSAAMMTITGLKNKVVDSLKVLGNEVTQPMTTAWKSFLAFAASGLDRIRELYSAGGIGNVFEALVPDPNTQTVIRSFLANFHNMLMSIASVLKVVSQVAGNFIAVLVNSFNIVAPVIINVVNVISYLLNAFLSTRAGAIALQSAVLAAAVALIALKVQAVGALVITALTKAVMGLARALLLLASLIVKHPIIAMLVGLTVALVSVSGASDRAGASLSRFFNSLSGGTKTSDVLKKTEGSLDGAAGSADKFTEKLGNSADAAKDLADNVGKAGKAGKEAKGLLSFDEVFKLNEPSTGGGGGLDGGELNGIDNLIDDLGALGGGLGDLLTPDIPDFSEYIDGFTDNLFGGLKDSLKSKFLSAGLGALLGGLLGGLFGKSLLGAKIGAAAGALAGFIWDLIADELELTDTGRFAIPIATALGAAIGFLVGGPGGAILGGGIGALVGWLIEGISKGIKEGDWSTLEKTLVTILGAVIGGTVGFLIGGPLGGTIGAFIGGVLANSIFTNLDGIKTKVNEWTSNTKNTFKDWKDNVSASIYDWGERVNNSIDTWIVNTRTNISNWYNETKANFSSWVSETSAGVHNWASETEARFNTWTSGVATNFNNWFSGVVKGFTDWKSNVSNNVSTWSSDTKKSFDSWVADTRVKFNNWKSSTQSTVSSWASTVSNSWKKLWNPDAWKSGWSLISKWFDKLISDISEWFTRLRTRVGNWWDSLWSNKSVSVNLPSGTGSSRVSMGGHASGGVFNREHIARFAEGNKAEAIIPLEEESAMRPFVDAVANGITQTLGPIIANMNAAPQQSLQPLYVGTLIADERGLKELNKRMHVIQLQEERRKGI